MIKIHWVSKARNRTQVISLFVEDICQFSIDDKSIAILNTRIYPWYSFLKCDKKLPNILQNAVKFFLMLNKYV